MEGEILATSKDRIARISVRNQSSKVHPRPLVDRYNIRYPRCSSRSDYHSNQCLWCR